MGGFPTSGSGSGGGSSDATSIQGIPVDATAPNAQEVLAYDGSQYTPVAGDAIVSIGDLMTAGTGLNLTSKTLKIANTTVTAAPYGSATQVPAITVNAQGQITAAANTSIAIDGSQVTAGHVAISQGGTGIGTAPSVAGQFLRSSGASTWAVAALQSGDVPGSIITSHSVTGAQIAATTFASVVVQGRNGTGSISLTGAVAGDKVLVQALVGTNDGTSAPPLLGSFPFETTITTNDQIQQSFASDLTKYNFNVLILHQ